MSLRYRDSSGNETIVSGLTPGGDIEAGAVMTRSGTGSITSTAGAWGTTTVIFDTPMPDVDYVINIEPINQTAGETATPIVISSKGITGFTAAVYGGTTAVTLAFRYTAWKIYSVQHAAQNAEDIANIKAVIPPAASSINQLTPKKYVDDADIALDGRVSNLEDLIPTGASITNKLATKAEIDNVYTKNEVTTKLDDKQDTLTFDNEPTAGSNNPVKSNGIKNAIDDTAADIYEVMGKNGAKNYFQSTAVDVGTRNGVTMTRNANGSFSFSGTCTSETGFSFETPQEKYDWTGYILSGCPEGGGSSTFYLRRRITNSSGTFIRHDCDYGQGVVLTALGADEYGTISVVIKTGQVMDGVTISPMVRLSQDTDSTYQSYAMTNKQLTEAVYDTGWILVSGANRYRKIGNIVYVHARYNMTQNITEEIIFTLPEGYRPTFDMMFQPATNNPVTYAEAYIKPSGEICFYGNNCVGIHFMLDCSFPI